MQGPLPSAARRIAAALGLASVLTAAAASPRLVADPEQVDFGVRGSHEIVEQTFILRNDGDGELMLHRTGAGCACTAPDLKGTRLLPGARVPLQVRVPLSGRRGAHRVTVMVESNDPRRPRLALILHGRISNEIEVRPAQVFLGPVQHAGYPVRTLRIRWPRRSSHSVTGAESLSPWFTATLNPDSGGRLWLVDISPRGTPPWGETRGSIRVHTTHPRFSVLDIPVIAQQVPGPLLWMPREVVVPPDARVQPVSRYVIIRTTRATTFSLTRIQTPPPITAEVRPLPGGGGFRVQFNQLRAEPGIDGKAIHIETDLPELPLIELPIRIGDPGEAPSS